MLGMAGLTQRKTRHGAMSLCGRNMPTMLQRLKPSQNGDELATKSKINGIKSIPEFLWFPGALEARYVSLKLDLTIM